MRFALLFFLAQVLPAQTVSPAIATDSLVSQLYEYVREYRAGLPSLSCDETIVSRELKKGKIRREVTLVGTLRVIRHDGAPKGFTENHNVHSVDGHAPPRRFPMPYWVEGGLADAHGFRDVAYRDCYIYEVTTQGRIQRLSLHARQNFDKSKCREVPQGSWRVVDYDAVSKQITHVEMGMSAQASNKLKHPYFATMDYAPQELGDRTVWLPVRLVARDDKGEREMMADYSNYHRYAATIEIQPVGEKSAE